MTTVFSKLSKLPDLVAVSQTPKLVNLDVDLIDKIKIVISKLKTTNQRNRPQIRGTDHRHLELLRIHVLSVIRTVMITKMKSCVYSVISGYTENVMQCLSLSIKS